MIDKRFYESLSEFKLKDIIASNNNYILNCDAILSDFKSYKGIENLLNAESFHITFFHNDKYLELLKNTKAGACILKEQYAEFLPNNVIPIVSKNPYATLAQISKIIYKERIQSNKTKTKIENIKYENSWVHKNSLIGDSVEIGNFSVIEEGVEIGDGSKIGSNTVIKAFTKIGKNNTIGDQVRIEKTISGDNVEISSGSKIGNNSFGFAITNDIPIDVPQLGRVIIGDNVIIGSNTCIDRGSFTDTKIGNNVRIHNLVEISHNVIIGDNCVLIAQVGIAGSSAVGKSSILAGQVGVNGHVTIGDNVKIAAKSGIMKSIPDGETVGGYPAVSIRDWHKQTVTLKKISRNQKK